MRFPFPLLALSSLALFSGCSLIPEPKPDATRYYTLATPPAAEVAAPTLAGAPRLGLRKVEVSPYLAKGVLVVRTSESEVLFDDFARWAEPLEASLTRLLQTCLQAEPQIGRVSLAPLSAEEERAFDLVVRLRRAEGVRTAAGAPAARLVAVIELHSTGAGSELLTQRVFSAPETAWDGHDYNTLVQALSSQVQLLSHEIASMVNSASQRTAAPAAATSTTTP